jgi:hypothetical protein
MRKRSYTERNWHTRFLLVHSSWYSAVFLEASQNLMIYSSIGWWCPWKVFEFLVVNHLVYWPWSESFHCVQLFQCVILDLRLFQQACGSSNSWLLWITWKRPLEKRLTWVHNAFPGRLEGLWATAWSLAFNTGGFHIVLFLQSRVSFLSVTRLLGYDPRNPPKTAPPFVGKIIQQTRGMSFPSVSRHLTYR